MLNYCLGFSLSFVFTLISFIIVISKILPSNTTIFIVVLMMFVQLITQGIFFLNLKFSTNNYWDFISLIFTIIIICIIFLGTIWIMSNLYFMTQNFNVL